MHTALTLLCFVVVIYSLIHPYPSGLLHWQCGNLTIASVSAKQDWLIFNLTPRGTYLSEIKKKFHWRNFDCTVYPKKCAHGSCLAVLCCGYIVTDLPISIRLTSLALWQSTDCLSVRKATLMNIGKFIMWIHYEWLHNHNKAKHNSAHFFGYTCRNEFSSMIFFFLISLRYVPLGVQLNISQYWFQDNGLEMTRPRII